MELRTLQASVPFSFGGVFTERVIVKDKRTIIKKAIKEAKNKKVNVSDYLAGGNEVYKGAIGNYRMVGFLGDVMVCMYLGSFLISFLIIADERNRLSLLFATLVLIIISAILLVICNRLEDISREPRRLKSYVILLLLLFCAPVFASWYLFLYLIPGLLSIAFFIVGALALSRYNNFAEWYNGFSYPIIYKRKKVKNNDVSRKNEHFDDEEYDDGL